jgi:hypothetical protein
MGSKRPGDLCNPQRQLRRVYLRYEGVCQICNDPVLLSHATREHVIPLSEGGTSDDDNVVLAHAKCNDDRNAASMERCAATQKGQEKHIADTIAKAIFIALMRQRHNQPVCREPRNKYGSPFWGRWNPWPQQEGEEW